ncbi:flagellar protein FliS [Bacillaceae bacterium SIJ1]|uniref:flagellar export chaperone FliS n=1 Tax=Litoribacterium kuwaitense TaxID=1398745 RepID=UPI0013E9DDCF|nr:flagellar export chaperone FliS [Litoribacterium kuwaitense]NGP44933.1 flagellar protein FliS [Litoribacterium kuwaitense]
MNEDVLHQKSPQELVGLLLEAALIHLEEGRLSIEAKQLQKANEALYKSTQVFRKLQEGIQPNAGIIADQLAELYRYLEDLTLQANVKKSIASIQLAETIVKEISSSWQNALHSNPPSQSLGRTVQQSYDRHVMTMNDET